MTNRSLPQTVNCLEKMSGIFIISMPVVKISSKKASMDLGWTRVFAGAGQEPDSILS